MPHTFDVMSALAPDGGTVRAVTDALDKVSGVQAASSMTTGWCASRERSGRQTC